MRKKKLSWNGIHKRNNPSNKLKALIRSRGIFSQTILTQWNLYKILGHNQKYIRKQHLPLSTLQISDVNGTKK